MSDLISRQAAVDAVMKLMPCLTTPDGTGKFDDEISRVQEMFVDIGQVLNDLPSAGRKGKWIKNRYCSFCEWDKNDFSYISGWKENFCPCCGVSMVEDMRCEGE